MNDAIPEWLSNSIDETLVLILTEADLNGPI